jgi:hypothetical protein
MPAGPSIVSPAVHVAELPTLDGGTPGRRTGADVALPAARARRDAPAGRPAWARSLPDKATLDYVRDGITTLLLVLALPWLVTQLVTNPGNLLGAVGRAKAVG